MGKCNKIFEEYETVDCNECERYWTNQCDGVKASPDAQKRPCNSFLATRNVVIPLQIKKLQNDVKWLLFGFIALVVINIVCTLINWWR